MMDIGKFGILMTLTMGWSLMVKGQVDTVPRVVRRILQQSNYNKNDLPYTNRVNGT